MENFEELLTLCQGKSVYIQTHNFPDPDAIGSAFGLQCLLAEFNQPSTLCYAGRIDKLSTSKMIKTLNIQIYPYEQLDMQPDDPIICVDSQKNSGNITDFIGDEIACIDHHPTFVPVDYAYKDVRIVGACATLITGYYASLKKVPSSDAATALLYALKMDTLQFSRGVTQQDIEAFGFLHPLCDKEKLTKLERNNMEFKDLKAYGAAIENIQLYDMVGISKIPFSCPDALIATLSDFILSLEEVDVAILYSQREDGIKFSVRSERSDIHAGELIRQALEGFGDGGGHAVMAGGLIGKENVSKLGRDLEYAIRDLFLKFCNPKN